MNQALILMAAMAAQAHTPLDLYSGSSRGGSSYFKSPLNKKAKARRKKNKVAKKSRRKNR